MNKRDVVSRSVEYKWADNVMVNYFTPFVLLPVLSVVMFVLLFSASGLLMSAVAFVKFLDFLFLKISRFI